MLLHHFPWREGLGLLCVLTIQQMLTSGKVRTLQGVISPVSGGGSGYVEVTAVGCCKIAAALAGNGHSNLSNIFWLLPQPPLLSQRGFCITAWHCLVWSFSVKHSLHYKGNSWVTNCGKMWALSAGNYVVLGWIQCPVYTAWSIRELGPRYKCL